MPISPAIALWLRGEGYTAIHVADLGMAKAADFSIVEFAREHGFTIITADLDFPRIISQAHTSRPGLILFRGGRFSEVEVRERLVRVLEKLAPTEIESSIISVDEQQIRRRQIPL